MTKLGRLIKHWYFNLRFRNSALTIILATVITIGFGQAMADTNPDINTPTAVDSPSQIALTDSTTRFPILLDRNVDRIKLHSKLPILDLQSIEELAFKRIQPVDIETLNAKTLVESGVFSPDNFNQSLLPAENGHWYRLEFIDQADSTYPVKESIESNWFLLSENHVLQNLDFYLFRKLGSEWIPETFKQGGALIRHQSVNPHHSDSISFATKPGDEIRILIYKQNNGPGIIPLSLLTDKGFAEFQENQLYWWGLFIGVFAALIIYNSIVFVIHLGPSYGWNILYQTIAFAVFGAMHGFGYLIWDGEIQTLIMTNITTLNFLVIWALLNFALSFFEIHNEGKIFKSISQFLKVSLPFSAIVSSFTPEYLVIPLFGVIQLAVSILAITLGIRSIKSHSKAASSFLLSWFAVILGGAIGMMTYLGVLPINGVTLHAYLLGSLVQMFSLSMALAFRFDQIEEQRMESIFIDNETELLNKSYLFSNFKQVVKEIELDSPKIGMLHIEVKGGDSIVGLSGVNTLEAAYKELVLRLNALRMKKNLIRLRLSEDSKKFFSGVALSNHQYIVFIDLVSNYKESIAQIHDLLSLPLFIQGIEIRFEITIGSIELKTSPMEIEEALRKLQVTMVAAQTNKTDWLEYSSDFDSLYQTQLSMVRELRSAISKRELKVELQPQFDIQTGLVVGAEALMRWRNKKYGLVSPSVFVPLAEKSGQVFDITYSLLHQVFGWLSKNNPEIHVSLNLSVLDLENKKLIPAIEEMIQSYGNFAHKIVLEITESEEIEDSMEILPVIDRLRKMNFNIAIDDFGTGYSSMMYISQLKPEELKIDRAFIQGIDKSFENQTIVKAIINISEALNARTVAEGIENPEELKILKELGVDNGQGFYWNRSISMERFEEAYLAP